MTPDDFRYCIELELRPGVVVAVVAPSHASLAAMVKLIGGAKAELEVDAVQEVTITRREQEREPTRRFVSRATRHF